MIRPGHSLFRKLLAIYWLSMFTLSHWPRLSVNVVDVPFGLDKWLHMGAFFVLTMLLAACRLWPDATAGRLRGLPIKPIAVVIVYSWIDELTQGLVPGRYIDGADALADALGALLGGLCWMILQRRRQRDPHAPNHSADA